MNLTFLWNNKWKVFFFFKNKKNISGLKLFIIFKRYSRGVTHAAILLLPRWSVKIIMTCLYKDNCMNSHRIAGFLARSALGFCIHIFGIRKLERKNKRKSCKIPVWLWPWSQGQQISGQAEAVRKWCGKNGRSSQNPTAEGFLFFHFKKTNLDRKKALRRKPALPQCFRRPWIYSSVNLILISNYSLNEYDFIRSLMEFLEFV